MPADEVEVTEGAEEGIFLHNSRGPRVILDGDGKVAGLRLSLIHISHLAGAQPIGPRRKQRCRHR